MDDFLWKLAISNFNIPNLLGILIIVFADLKGWLVGHSLIKKGMRLLREEKERAPETLKERVWKNLRVYGGVTLLFLPLGTLANFLFSTLEVPGHTISIGHLFAGFMLGVGTISGLLFMKAITIAAWAAKQRSV